MASTVCLNQLERTAVYEVAIVALGAFGAAVAERLKGSSVWVYKGEPFDIDVSKLPLANSYVMVAGHPCPQLEIHLCQMALKWKRRFIPVVHEHPYVRSGPVTHAGALACSACYDKRIHQHTASTEIPDRMADEYMHRGDEVLPRGILPVWADVASGLVMLRLAQDPELDARTSRQMFGVDLISGGVISAEVIGVDGCQVCSRDDVDPLNRSVRVIPSVLSATMSGGHHGTE